VTAFVLLRHVRAVSRRDWEGDDALRPLDARGEKQAKRLVDRLADRDLERIVSSPYVRCVESVRPLAAARGLDIEERAEIAEGASPADAFALLDEVEGSSSVVLCTHGDVAYELLGQEMKKGEFRIVERSGDRLRTVA
jgi:phosphohistidine phosphatase SixA